MRWMWIDQIVEFVPNQKMVAVKNVSLAEEHLHDHFPGAPLMPASLIIEGMAQTAGILVGSVNRFREKVILAKVALARLDADVVPGQVLRYVAALERMDAAGASTHGLVSCRDARGESWRPVGEINLLFSHLDQNMSGVEFPEENFVFSENFRTILQTAGLAHLAD